MTSETNATVERLESEIDYAEEDISVIVSRDLLEAARDEIKRLAEQYAIAYEGENTQCQIRYMVQDEADHYKAKLDETTAERDQLKGELEEQKQSFDLYWKASQRGIKAYQEKHGIPDGSWPDRADLVCWLMERIDELSEEADDLENENGLVHDCNDGNKETIASLKAELEAVREDAEVGLLARILRPTIEPAVQRLEGQSRTSVEIHGDSETSPKAQLAEVAHKFLQALAQEGGE